ncbi:hypothetical protein KFK09_022940 [Dendrobium nobile]|uniref:Stigma-specific STIG1-like protein 1 n=1 Tax=Dendrobium nobile TaxID=94219 RepID=A0A8T3AJM9_DENNO|nr:hypothetical protein KFK09_022940 [Dendrobium nobile]
MSNGFLEKYYVRATMTCDKFSRICRVDGSARPNCCKKQCVNVMVDGIKCGEWEKKCRYKDKCCDGRCINVMFDSNNCGGCHSPCKKGSFCRYGMCSYA